jgi:hypothetical protein
MGCISVRFHVPVVYADGAAASGGRRQAAPGGSETCPEGMYGSMNPRSIDRSVSLGTYEASLHPGKQSLMGETTIGRANGL